MKKKFLLLSSTLILVFLSVEITLRFRGYDPLSSYKNGRESILQPSQIPGLTYELRPGAAGFAWNADIKINSYGFRAPEPRLLKNDTKRILILGDSITFGNFLPIESVYPHVLQQELDPHREKAEVLNMGVGGFDILQEVQLLKNKGLVFNPDVVVVGFCLNDIGIVSTNWEFMEMQERMAKNIFLKFRIVQFLTSRLFRYKYENWLTYKNLPETFRKDFSGQIDPIGQDETQLRQWMSQVPDLFPSQWYGDHDKVGRIRFTFRTLKNMATENKFSVVVALIPWLEGDSLSYPHETAHKIIHYEAGRLGFPVLDLTDAFKEAGFKNLQIHPHDQMHPNAQGHRIIANALTDFLRKGKGVTH